MLESIESSLHVNEKIVSAFKISIFLRQSALKNSNVNYPSNTTFQSRSISRHVTDPVWLVPLTLPRLALQVLEEPTRAELRCRGLRHLQSEQ